MLDGAPATILFAVPFLFLIYRRVRRRFGQRKIRRRLLILRASSLSLLGIVLLSMPWTSVPALATAAVAGSLLAWIGLGLTTFEQRNEGLFYRQNHVIGLILSSLLLGRLAYRTSVLLTGKMRGDVAFDPSGRGPASLTLLILFVMVGYYVSYNAGLLFRSRDTGSAPVA